MKLICLIIAASSVNCQQAKLFNSINKDTVYKGYTCHKNLNGKAERSEVSKGDEVLYFDNNECSGDHNSKSWGNYAYGLLVNYKSILIRKSRNKTGEGFEVHKLDGAYEDEDSDSEDESEENRTSKDIDKRKKKGESKGSEKEKKKKGGSKDKDKQKNKEKKKGKSKNREKEKRKKGGFFDSNEGGEIKRGSNIDQAGEEKGGFTDIAEKVEEDENENSINIVKKLGNDNSTDTGEVEKVKGGSTDNDEGSEEKEGSGDNSEGENDNGGSTDDGEGEEEKGGSTDASEAEEEKEDSKDENKV